MLPAIAGVPAAREAFLRRRAAQAIIEDVAAREISSDLSYAFGLKVHGADLLYPLDSYFRDLQQNARRPAWHLDRGTPAILNPEQIQLKYSVGVRVGMTPCGRTFNL